MAYFDQGVQYFSGGREELLTISEMHPGHAGNAAEKLLREAERWATESDSDFCGSVSGTLWMTTTPLFRALVARAGER